MSLGTHGSLTTKPKRGDRMATRRVVVQELVSVDGFVAGPSGELDFFEEAKPYASGIVSLSYAVTRS